MSKYIRSPLNYIGGKYKILPQIFPLFPNDIACFVDLFAGGANVGINSSAEKIVLNDNLVYLIEMYEALMERSEKQTLDYIDQTILRFDLSLTNTEGYNRFRDSYNQTRNSLDLLILTFFSFNHQIRFNSKHQFNTPFGKNRSRYNENIKKNLIDFLSALHTKNVHFTKQEFDAYDFSELTANDLVYCDPPYLITVGSYNDGKRGFTGWGEGQEKKLLTILSGLDSKGVRFALSNVLTHKHLRNDILMEWIQENGYTAHKIDRHYANANYHTSKHEKDTTREVLITNY